MKGNVSLGILLGVLLIITISSFSLIVAISNGSVLSAQDSSVFAKYLYPITQKVTLKQNKSPQELDTSFAVLTSNIKKVKGDFSVYILDNTTNKTYEYNANQKYYAASLFKLIVAQAAYTKLQTGAISLNTDLTLLTQDYSSGTGILNTKPTGSTYSLDFVLDRLLKDSDNTAQNMILRYVPDNELNAEFEKLDPSSSFLAENIASPVEVSEFINILYPEIVKKMEQTSFDDRINSGLSSDITFAHKIGNWNSSWHDCGLATKQDQSIIVCVMSGNTTLENFKVVTKDVGEFVSNLF